MSETGRRYLRAVTAVPGSVADHGVHLTEANGQISTEMAEILSKLELIFAWPDLSNTTATLVSTPPVAVACRIASDPDEAVPTELFITFLDEKLRSRLSMLKKLKINVELFRTCYQFDVEVASVGDLEDPNSPIVVSIPNSITTLRARNLPRVKVAEEHSRAFPRVSWKSDTGQSMDFMSVAELGLNSVAGTLPLDSISGTGEISIGELTIRGHYVRRKGDLHVFQLQLESVEEFGKLFDLYRRIAFPDLRARAEFAPEQVFALYTKTKYLSQFVAQVQEGTLLHELSTVWKNVATAQHTTSADYITIDNENQLCGASSVTRAFEGQSCSVWAFHQLCSVASPDLLDRSGQLYLWRAEYLFGRPEMLKVVAWFRSESRWLERIYVKFEKLTHGKSKLRPVAWVRGLYQTSGSGIGKAEVSTIQFGDLSRTASYSEKDGQICAGAGPEYLNACASLNGALDLEQDHHELAPFRDASDAILAKMNKTEYPMHFTLAHGSPVPEGFDLHPSDRFLVIEKEDLGDFLSCIEHSISLTRKKYTA